MAEEMNKAGKSGAQESSSSRLSWQINRNGDTLEVILSGRLDTLTSPRLEQALEPEIETAAHLVLDLRDLIYLSSVGLRLIMELLMMTKEAQGSLKVRNAQPEVMEVFRMTGFHKILIIE